MIFKFLKWRKMAREGMEDPGKLAAGEATGLVVGSLVAPVLIALAVLGIFYILGFVEIWGFGPYPFFQKLFYLGAGVAVLGGVFIWVFVKLVRRVARKAIQAIGKDRHPQE